jgi:hypothetical protein
VLTVTPLASTKPNGCSTLVYDKPDEQAWLVERFEMYKKDLEKSWVYQQRGYFIVVLVFRQVNSFQKKWFVIL